MRVKREESLNNVACLLREKRLTTVFKTRRDCHIRVICRDKTASGIAKGRKMNDPVIRNADYLLIVFRYCVV